MFVESVLGNLIDYKMHSADVKGKERPREQAALDSLLSITISYKYKYQEENLVRNL